MKLTLVGPAFPIKGGISHHVRWLEEELGRREHDIQTISFKLLYPSLLLRLFHRAPSFDTSKKVSPTRAVSILHPFNPLTWLSAARAIRAFGPRGVVIQWWSPFFAPVLGCLARLVKRPGTEIVFECHNVLPHERTPVDRLALRFAFASASAFLVHSQKVLEELRTLSPTKPAVVASLPVLDEFAGDRMSDRSGRVILFFGLVRKYKGLEVLLAALPKVLSRESCKLIVAGEFYVPVEKYLAMARELGIEDHVHIENRYIPNEEVPLFLDRADVLVMPYLSATQSGVVEMAFMNRLPIIASRTGGLVEAIREGVDGLLFPPGDAGALADCLLRYFEEGLGPTFSRNLETRRDSNSDLCHAIERLLG